MRLDPGGSEGLRIQAARRGFGVNLGVRPSARRGGSGQAGIAGSSQDQQSCQAVILCNVTAFVILIRMESSKLHKLDDCMSAEAARLCSIRKTGLITGRARCSKEPGSYPARSRVAHHALLSAHAVQCDHRSRGAQPVAHMWLRPISWKHRSFCSTYRPTPSCGTTQAPACCIR